MENTLSAGDQFLAHVTQIIEENIGNENFSVKDLADGVGMSRSMLHRKLIKLTGKSASEFIKYIRITKARELLENDVATVSEIAYRVGFRSPSYFIKVFKKIYNVSPGDFRKRSEAGQDLLTVALKSEIKTSALRRRSGYFIKGGIILLILVIAAGGIYYLTGLKRQSVPEKSLAILPFINDSPEETEMYFINGTMEAILNKLTQIEDLRVVSRTSLEQYRDNPKPVQEIAREMNVSYILEGSGQKYGNNIRLTLQLIDAVNDGHIWSDEFDRQIQDIEELFALQSEIAQLVAAEIKAKITPEEKQRMEEIPTTSQKAYHFYLRGVQEYYIYHDHLIISHYSDREALERAEDLFRQALEYDPTYVDVYCAIAGIYNFKFKEFGDTDLSPRYLDSMKLYVDYALQYDDQLAHAYEMRAYYYQNIGERERAIEDFRKTLELDPKNVSALNNLAFSHQQDFDFVAAIENFHKAVLISPRGRLPYTLRFLSRSYFLAGLKDQSDYYSKQALELDGDSVQYYFWLASSEYFISNNASKALELLKCAHAIDSSNTAVLSDLAGKYLEMGQYSESLRYIERKIARLNALGQADLYSAFMTGLVYSENGNKDMADYYFDQQIEYCRTLIKRHKDMYSTLAMVYAYRGEREKAYESLRELNQMERSSVYINSMFQDNIFFESIQNEPEFLELKSELTAKYKAERERVRQWLEENDML